ncbi:unnamed protein product [Parascedosporium putredinis]|uniref:BCS1 N-terminal domain-containing protein n=1 Tax=Parascedosporium putredinis TaxID=1442378 RepID=A0A9P1H7Y4_9PEZI|nr:unnamed protein product [Parascedosporium putredinis]CAI8000162.1 unnamed protein product [Parascedosporium putredinis]
MFPVSSSGGEGSAHHFFAAIRARLPGVSTLLNNLLASSAAPLAHFLESSLPMRLLQTFFAKWQNIDIPTWTVAIAILGTVPTTLVRLRAVVYNIYWWIAKYFVSSISVAGNDQLNKDVINWVAHNVLPRRSIRMLNARTEVIQTDYWKPSVTERNDIRHDNRVPVHCQPEIKFGAPESAIPIELSAAPEGHEPLVLMCLGRSVKPLKKFWRRAATSPRSSAASTSPCARRKSTYTGEMCWGSVALRPVRQMETVHFDEKIKSWLVRDIAHYLEPSTREYYVKRGIPYRRGYLLHVHQLTPKCIILLEDIDTVGVQRRGLGDDSDASDSDDSRGGGGRNKFNYSYHGPGCSLAGLLNVLDGVASQEGRIVLMTSNFAQKLDRALVRPGRIDQMIYLGYISRASAVKMFLRMYSVSCPKVSGSGADAAAATTNDKVDAETLEKLAGFLLGYKEEPRAAVAGIVDWVAAELKLMEEAERYEQERENRRKKREAARRRRRLRRYDDSSDDEASSSARSVRARSATHSRSGRKPERVDKGAEPESGRDLEKEAEKPNGEVNGSNGLENGKSPGSDFEKSDFYLATALTRPQVNWKLEPSFPDSLDFLSERDLKRYRTQRRLVGPIYHISNLKRFEAAVDEVLGKSIAQLNTLKGSPVDLKEWMHIITVECLGAVVLSWSPGLLKQKSDGGSGPHSYLGWRKKSVFGLFPLIVCLECVWKSAGRFFAVSWDITYQAPRNFKPFFTGVHRQTKNGWPGLPTEYLKRMTVTNFGAGHETMTSTLTSVMSMVCSRPDVLGHVVDEIEQTSDAARYEGFKASLSYTQACIKEAQRLFPVIGMSLPRQTPAAGFRAHGYYFPQAPRWARDNIREMDKFNLTWGGGSRTCPGRQLAELVVPKIIVSLLKEFNVEVDVPPEETMPVYFMAMMSGVKARFLTKDAG